jgi:hypothetical protein
MHIDNQNGWWIAMIAAVFGIPVVGILGSVFSAWLQYRYRRAALDTLKSYAANGREPPEALIKALTPGPRTVHGRGDWDWDWDWGHEPDDEPRADRGDDDAQDRAEGRRQRFAERVDAKVQRRMWKEARWRHRHSAGVAWQKAIFWATLGLGFWLAGTNTDRHDLASTLVIISYILGAVAAGAVLSAILTTVERLNGRRPD